MGGEGAAAVILPRRAAWRLLGAALAALLVGCAQPSRAPLYLWEDFPRQQYDTLLRPGMGPDEQIRAIQAHIEKARGLGASLPPGLRAHLGMLYLGMGNADEARQLWQAEKLAFPESTPFMDQLLKRLGEPAKKAAST
jgi:hypothetical protein